MLRYYLYSPSTLFPRKEVPILNLYIGHSEHFHIRSFLDAFLALTFKPLFFYVLLTVHLSIILVINQLNAQILDVLLTVHLSIILVINQLNAQILDVFLTVHLSIILVINQINTQIL